MYNLFLDDVRMPEDVANYIFPVELRLLYRLNEWKIVRSHKEFVAHIVMHGLPGMISFDHDLADSHYEPETWKEDHIYDEETGYDCAKWLVDHCLKNKKDLPDFLVHSMNPVGSKNIRDLLNNFQKFQSNDDQ